jgi:hypothetical protein
LFPLINTQGYSRDAVVQRFEYKVLFLCSCLFGRFMADSARSQVKMLSSKTKANILGTTAGHVYNGMKCLGDRLPLAFRAHPKVLRHLSSSFPARAEGAPPIAEDVPAFIEEVSRLIPSFRGYTQN